MKWLIEVGVDGGAGLCGRLGASVFNAAALNLIIISFFQLGLTHKSYFLTSCHVDCTLIRAELWLCGPPRSNATRHIIITELHTQITRTITLI